jgi:hypothetical protein
MLVCNVEETLYGNLHCNKCNGFDAIEFAVWKEVQEDAWSRSVAEHATGQWAVLMVLFFGSYRGLGIISADGELRGNIRSVEDCN